MGAGSIIGNIIWLIFGGLEIALCYFVSAILLCCTIIGIPFGIQLFKIGVVTLLPFGAILITKPQSSGCFTIIATLLWIITFGIIIAAVHLFSGILLCITIIGIPFGKQHFKLMRLAITPFDYSV